MHSVAECAHGDSISCCPFMQHAVRVSAPHLALHLDLPSDALKQLVRGRGSAPKRSLINLHPEHSLMGWKPDGCTSTQCCNQHVCHFLAIKLEAGCNRARTPQGAGSIHDLLVGPKAFGFCAHPPKYCIQLLLSLSVPYVRPIIS